MAVLRGLRAGPADGRALPGGPVRPGEIALAGVLMALSIAVIVVGPWHRWPQAATQIVVVALCATVFLLRAGSSDGASAGFSSLLLVPVIWQALRRDRRHVHVTLVIVTASNVAAALVLSSPVSGAAQGRGIVLFTAMSVTAAVTIRRLVVDRARLLDEVTARGGEEFALLLPGSTAAEATRVLERLLAVTPEGQTFSAGVTIGTAGDSCDELVSRADAAMYAAKAAGRACVRIDATLPVDGGSPRPGGTRTA